LGGSVISVGTIHDLRRVKVPGTDPLRNPWDGRTEVKQYTPLPLWGAGYNFCL
jgi:hypothetical protein